MEKSYTDEQICEAIRKGGPEMEQAVRYLFHRGLNREQIIAFVRSRNGSKEDAEDIFQESMRSLILNIRNGKFRAEGSIQAYVYAICKNLWFKRFQKIRREAEWEEQPGWEGSTDVSPEALLLEQDQQEQMREVLALVGEKCLKVLELWRMSYSMREIAVAMGYKGEHVARKKKSQCFRSLLDILDAHPALLKMLEEMKWGE